MSAKKPFYGPIGTPGMVPRLLCPGGQRACDCDQQHKRGELPFGHKCGPAWQRSSPNGSAR
jgi:hypothetical protein